MCGCVVYVCVCDVQMLVVSSECRSSSDNGIVFCVLYSPQPYEQVANSINYQLLHQNHPSLSSKLIDSLYPTLKVRSCVCMRSVTQYCHMCILQFSKETQ